jgi:hypothetical protein
MRFKYETLENLHARYHVLDEKKDKTLIEEEEYRRLILARKIFKEE